MASVQDFRRRFNLEYDKANALLNAFMRLIYQRAYNTVIPSGFEVAGLSVEQLSEIHSHMFNLIGSYADSPARSQIPLIVLLGAAAPAGEQNSIILRLFGSDSADERAAYFKRQIGEELYNQLLKIAPILKVQFKRFNPNLNGILLSNAAGPDNVQYHMTVARDRIRFGRLSSYHFSNHYYPRAHLPKHTYYKNDGSPIGISESMKAADRELGRGGREMTEVEAEQYSRALAWLQHIEAPTANTRREIGEPVLMTRAEEAAGGGGGGGSAEKGGGRTGIE